MGIQDGRVIVANFSDYKDYKIVASEKSACCELVRKVNSRSGLTSSGFRIEQTR